MSNLHWWNNPPYFQDRDTVQDSHCRHNHDPRCHSCNISGIPYQKLLQWFSNSLWECTYKNIFSECGHLKTYILFVTKNHQFIFTKPRKFFFSIYLFLCLWYELSACPLLLNSNKAYFSSSLIARPIANVVWCLSFWLTMCSNLNVLLSFMFFDRSIHTRTKYEHPMKV